ncbi:MAG: UDP-3-O-(3-hydroxymyristoyl)glucosamine N-acyltransferase [bacterium]
MPSFRLSELATVIGADLAGDSDPVISGVASIEAAGPGDITFINKKSLLPNLEVTRASAVLVPPDVECSLPVLRLEDPYAGFVQILQRFAPAREVLFPAGVHPSAVIDAEARIHESVAIGPCAVVAAGAIIGAGSALGPHVIVGAETVIGENCLLYAGAIVRERCVLGREVILQAGAVIGSDGFGYIPGTNGMERVPQIGRVVLEDGVEVGANACIDRATTGDTVIGAGTKIDNLVQIAHNVQVGRHCALSAQCGIAGSCRIGDGVQMGGQVGIGDHLEVGAEAKLAGKSGIWRNIPAGQITLGYPAFERKATLQMVANVRKLPDLMKRLGKLEDRLLGNKQTGKE